MGKIILILLASLLLCWKGWGQEHTGEVFEMPQYTPTAPNIASLGKYGEFPVGHYSGTPVIEIPFAVDKKGDCYWSFSAQTLYQFNRKGEEIAAYRVSEILFGSAISHVFANSEGNIFVGTQKNGIFIFDKKHKEIWAGCNYKAVKFC